MVTVFLGLAGLFPVLSEGAPRLARAGLATVAIAGAALVAFPVCLYAKTSGVALPVPPVAGFLLAGVATTVGVLLFGVASLHTGSPSGAVGVLLVATGATFVVLFGADLLYGGAPAWVDVAVTGVQAVLLLAVGYALPSATTRAGDAVEQVDVPSG